jgi:hypothetical protein
MDRSVSRKASRSGSSFETTTIATNAGALPVNKHGRDMMTVTESSGLWMCAYLLLAALSCHGDDVIGSTCLRNGLSFHV